eukprot:356261-Chlamydomonas_euryale.AAC.2
MRGVLGRWTGQWKECAQRTVKRERNCEDAFRGGGDRVDALKVPSCPPARLPTSLPACPLRHRRRADRRHVHAVARQQRRRRADRCSLAAQHDRHHRAQRRKRQRQAQAARQRPHVRASPRLARCHTQRGQSRRDRGQWQRSGVHVGAASARGSGSAVECSYGKAIARAAAAQWSTHRCGLCTPHTYARIYFHVCAHVRTWRHC